MRGREIENRERGIENRERGIERERNREKHSALHLSKYNNMVNYSHGV